MSVYAYAQYSITSIEDGGKWYNGTGITGTSTTPTIYSGSGVERAIVGDMYINTSTQNIYRCTVEGPATVAKWIYVSNIAGKRYYLVADTMIVSKTPLSIYSPDIVYFRAYTSTNGTSQSLSGYLEISWSSDGGSNWSSPTGTTGSSASFTITGHADITTIKCVLYDNSSSKKLLDQQTVQIILDQSSLEIGGVNLLEDSQEITVSKNSTKTLMTGLDNNCYYTFSVMSSTGPANYSVSLAGQSTQLATSNTRLYFTKLTNVASGTLTVTNSSTIQDLILHKVKLERGNIVTDWDYSPDDISRIDGTATSAQESAESAGQSAQEAIDSAADAQSKISNIESTFDSRVSGSTLAGRVNSVEITQDDLKLSVTDTMSDLSKYNSVFSFESLGLRISNIVTEARTSDLTVTLSSKVYHVYVRFASSSSGSDMSPTPKDTSQYIGIYVSESSAEPSLRSYYKWGSISQTTGIDMGDGTYTWVKYANDTDGTGLSDSPTGKEYILLGILKTTATKSSSVTTTNYPTSLRQRFRNQESPVATYYTSSGMIFKATGTNGEVLGSVTYEGFRLKNAIIEDGGILRLGKYVWKPMSDGSLSFLYQPISE